ncbi:hypothetical protein EVAR_6400_1 [Eumeta japonica]|uniref:Uncharacterized protein n=1 Tax=Eumeta variegata TaxID=151549 RepID=A0A4C1TDD7_EUMVA|nr:hypothetical protein EVAR_6400_1 [Eumeta japonica]
MYERAHCPGGHRIGDNDTKWISVKDLKPNSSIWKQHLWDGKASDVDRRKRDAVVAYTATGHIKLPIPDVIIETVETIQTTQRFLEPPRLKGHITAVDCETIEMMIMMLKVTMIMSMKMTVSKSTNSKKFDTYGPVKNKQVPLSR